MQPHQSRFKAYLVSPEQRALELPHIQAVALWLKERSTQVSPAEQVTLFVLMFLELRNPNSWAMSSGLQKKNSFREGLGFKDFSGPFDFLKCLKSCESIDDILLGYRPRRLPQAIFDVLLRWRRGEYNLVLMDRAPTPQEMLNQQAEGRRVVTLSWKDALCGTLVDGRRDAFEFLLHDLIHADLFLKDTQFFLEQKYFFSRLKSIIEGEDLILKADEIFLGSLFYLMADMNSHKAHLEAHWRAILIQWQLRQENKNSHDSLSESGSLWVESLVQRIRKQEDSEDLRNFSSP